MHPLSTLLPPIQNQARRTARRLCHSWAEGDDLFQEAALRAFAKFETLRDTSRFRPWFYQVMLSVHRERARRAWVRNVILLANPFGNQVPTAPQGEPEATLLITQGLQRLPALEREALVLFEVDGYSLEEVAEMQGATVAAVKTRLFRGRKRLRDYYEQEDLKREPWAKRKPRSESPGI